jgi:hypothetical protein
MIKKLVLTENELFDILKVFHDEKLYIGRMLWHSKSAYIENNPDNKVIFNANIVLEKNDSFLKIWYGDLDLTLDYKVLKKISQKIGYKFHVLYEMDARFDREYNPLIGESVWDTDLDVVPTIEWFRKNKNNY